jgi:hypothetical protein
MRTGSKRRSRTAWPVCVIYERHVALLYATTTIDVTCIIAISLCVLVLIARVFLCNALCIISLINDVPMTNDEASVRALR